MANNDEVICREERIFYLYDKLSVDNGAITHHEMTEN